MVDAPRKNPERDEVLRLLQGCAGWKDTPALTEDEARGRVEQLAAVERTLNEWMNRRAEQSLPPPRDGLHLAEVVQSEHRKLVAQGLKNGWTRPPVAGFEDLPDTERQQMQVLWAGLVADSGPLRAATPQDAGDVVTRTRDRLTEEARLKAEEEARKREAERIARLPPEQRPKPAPRRVSHSSDDEFVLEPEDWSDSDDTGAPPAPPTEEELARRRKEEEETRRRNEIEHKTRLLMQVYKTAAEVPDATVFEDFRAEMLSDIARLMTVPSGREILGQLTEVAAAKGMRVDFLPGKEPCCRADDTSLAQGKPKGDAAMPRELTPGPGSSCLVELPIGQRDGDTLAATRDGNPIFAPTPVLLGHELLHALHDLTGTSRHDVPKAGLTKAGLDAVWSNFEEYWTIKGGEISEEAIRRDYGLAAERFGHGPPLRESGPADAAMALADVGKKTADIGPEKIDAALQSRGFAAATVARMTDATRYALFQNETITGPLPDGWNPAGLDAATIGMIARDRLPYRLGSLGWTPFGLPYEAQAVDDALGFPRAIKAITQCEVYHPASARGRRFAALGGTQALDALARLKQAKGIDLGRRSNDNWPANLATLEAADAEIDRHLREEERAAQPRLPLPSRIGLAIGTT